MVTRFEPRADLDVLVARRYAYPAVDAALERIRDLARTNAPPVKVWVTARDERVRPSHIEADGQSVPANLRFKVPTTYAPHDPTQWDLAGHPRDPDLPAGNRINCRCMDPLLPELLARSIHRTVPTIQGTRVHGEVYTHFPRAAESEFGTTQDTPAHFMRDALRETALTMSSRQRT
jgi:hypothetical protein